MSNATALEIAEEIARQRFELEVAEAGISARRDALDEANYAYMKAREALEAAERTVHDALVAMQTADGNLEDAWDRRADVSASISELSALLVDATLGHEVGEHALDEALAAKGKRVTADEVAW